MLPHHRKTPDTLTMLDEAVVSQPCISASDSIATTPSKLTQPGIESTAAAHYDLVIIGAGPAALAVISRIFESRPAALYTEDEHRHLHFTHKQRTPSLIPSKVSKASKASRTSISPELEEQARLSRKKKGKSLWKLTSANNGDEICSCDGRIKILVIDKLGEGFMGLWRRNFRALGISHLRSPMFFHPDASDFDALIAYANQHGKAGEGTPKQVIDLIEKRIATDKGFATAPRGRGCRRSCKGKRSLSPFQASDQSCESDHTSLPDLIEILGVVGREKSKHKRKQNQLRSKDHRSAAFAATNIKVHVNERDRRDYFTPSSSLFDSFTRGLERKYGVQPCENCSHGTWPKISQFFADNIEGSSNGEAEQKHAGVEGSPITTLKGRVKELAWCDGGDRTVQDDFGNHHPGFLMELDDGSPTSQNHGTVVSAKVVVSAVGFGGMPMIPVYLSSTNISSQQSSSPKASSSPSPCACGPGWIHSSCLASQPFPRPTILSSPASTRLRHMVVVGGGLTSAQIVVRALEEGYDKVTLLTRGHLKSKPFDVDLGWVGRYSNYLKMQFWQNENVEERLATLDAAKNGGSVTPTYANLLARLQALGKVEIRTHTTITSAAYRFCGQKNAPLAQDQNFGASNISKDGEGQEDERFFEEPCNLDDSEDCDRQWNMELLSNGNSESIRADYLIVATGAKVNFGSLPFLEHLLKTHPIRLARGMPVLTADLEYRRDVPLFVTGAYAGLQIGPAAGNLGGMRDSADRIANRLLELLSLQEGVVPNVISLPQTVVSKHKYTQLPNSNKNKQDQDREHQEVLGFETKNRSIRAEQTSPFTHFNFDLLSIEA
ncbi:uncharacterized protein MEPE_03052 [Melanopsichium pennsylvanicum]|uniref:L-ornithine N(5)-oxygenase n=2 Tax=Melanopsichium pennsylvanicum TaxID=63383 RepID=A0AAJ5C596_9BASI|nr:conserved hypothetical protein [Melanopsichium pennsylvanicum 4]SNX84343.1 uncharacterized protein MEPE_03052 [Melanopsichium pennsylvanicum]